MIALLALVLPLLSGVAADLAANCSRTAVVQAGDTCDSISSKYGSPSFQFALLNFPAVDTACSNLQIGATVCLGTTTYDCRKIVTVAENDTCYKLSEAYGLDTHVLYINNPQIDSDCGNIYPGQVLCVDTEVTRYYEYDIDLFDNVTDDYLPYCDELEDEGYECSEDGDDAYYFPDEIHNRKSEPEPEPEATADAGQCHKNHARRSRHHMH